MRFGSETLNRRFDMSKLGDTAHSAAQALARLSKAGAMLWQPICCLSSGCVVTHRGAVHSK